MENNISGVNSEEKTGLESYGIECELVPNSDESALIDAGYKRIPKEALEGADMLMQYIPGQLAQIVATQGANDIVDGAYKVVLKEGLHLGKSHAMQGAYRGLAYNSNNALQGQVNLIPLDSAVSAAPQIALGVFSASSIVTGQYFMAQINGKLSELKTGVSDILGFLEDEKRSEIMADEEILTEIFQNIRFVKQNEIECKTTSDELKRIRNKSLKNIYFFKSQTSGIVIDPDDKKDVIERKLQKYVKDFPEYWCSVNNYMMSTLLDVIITGMDSPEYLDSLKGKMQKCYSDYLHDFEACNEMIGDIISNGKEFNKKKIIPQETIDLIESIPLFDVLVPVLKPGVLVADAVGNIKEAQARHFKDNTKSKQKDLISACRNYIPFENTLQFLEEYKTLRNKPIEILYCKDSAFIKCEEEHIQDN